MGTSPRAGSSTFRAVPSARWTREATAILAGHLEAGQIEFRARDVDGGLRFEIETWSRPGELVAALVFDQLKVGKEVQLTMWAEFCMAIPRLAGGRRVGPVDIETRRLPWPPPDAIEENVPGRASG